MPRVKASRRLRFSSTTDVHVRRLCFDGRGRPSYWNLTSYRSPKYFVLAFLISFALNRVVLADTPGTPQPKKHDASVQKLKTSDDVEFGLWGRIDGMPQPTLIVLASTIKGTLDSPYFRQCGNQLAGDSGWLCVSIDLPCHGTQQRDGETGGISGWRERVEREDDFVKAFNVRLAGVLDYLIENEYTDPKHIAVCGTSRGGFLAIHFAAFDRRVSCAAGFAPVTDLAMLKEFKGIEDHPLTKALSLEEQATKLANRAVWIGIGDQDQRVSTDSAIHLARRLTAAKCEVDLHVFPEPRGHTTPKGAPEMVSQWILAVSGQ